MEVKLQINSLSLFVFALIASGYFLVILSILKDSHGSQSAVLDERHLRSIDGGKIVEVEQRKDIQLSSKSLSEEKVKFKTFHQGVIVLGMHRSGTSVLGGLLTKMGLKTGGPLIPPAADNEKGFFERIDVVVQNDALLENQDIHYAGRTYKYDALRGLSDILGEHKNFFNEGRRALDFLNAESNYPWMLKDPRLCITLRTWLPLLDYIPAVIFTYRHPFDVALSLHKREHFLIGRGLRLWYVYNRRAVLQSKDLCRVVISHKAMMTHAQIELDRVYDELHSCGLDVPKRISKEDVETFIDSKLQHGKNTLQDNICETKDFNSLQLPEQWDSHDPDHLALYKESIRVYCAFEDKSAFDPSFKWDMDINDA